MNNIYKLSLLFISLIFTQTAFADVKIKTRQTMSGQTYEGTVYIKGKRQRTERNMGGSLIQARKLILLTHSMREQLRRKQQRTRKTIKSSVRAEPLPRLFLSRIQASANNCSVLRRVI